MQFLQDPLWAFAKPMFLPLSLLPSPPRLPPPLPLFAPRLQSPLSSTQARCLLFHLFPRFLPFPAPLPLCFINTAQPVSPFFPSGSLQILQDLTWPFAKLFILPLSLLPFPPQPPLNSSPLPLSPSHTRFPLFPLRISARCNSSKNQPLWAFTKPFPPIPSIPPPLSLPHILLFPPPRHQSSLSSLLARCNSSKSPSRPSPSHFSSCVSPPPPTTTPTVPSLSPTSLPILPLGFAAIPPRPPLGLHQANFPPVPSILPHFPSLTFYSSPPPATSLPVLPLGLAANPPRPPLGLHQTNFPLFPSPTFLLPLPLPSPWPPVSPFFPSGSLQFLQHPLWAFTMPSPSVAPAPTSTAANESDSEALEKHLQAMPPLPLRHFLVLLLVPPPYLTAVPEHLLQFDSDALEKHLQALSLEHLLQFDSEALEKHLQAVLLPSLLLLAPHDQAIFFPDEVTRPLSYAGVLVMSLLLLSPYDRATFFLDEAQQQSQPRQDISSSFSHWWLDPGCYATDESDWVAVEAIHSGAEEFRAVGDEEEGESREGGRHLGRQQGEENELQQQQKQQLQKSFLPLTPQPAAASGLAPSTQEGTAKQQLEQLGEQAGSKNDGHGFAEVDGLDELLGGQAGGSSGATRAENLQTKQQAEAGEAAPVNTHGHGHVHGFAGEDDLDELLGGQVGSSRGAIATKEDVKTAGGLRVVSAGAAQVKPELKPAAAPQTPALDDFDELLGGQAGSISRITSANTGERKAAGGSGVAKVGAAQVKPELKAAAAPPALDDFDEWFDSVA
ncbi:unnamed protein product [Closterium sp. NIES-65]|nr:unnamed protein product [Closterium sp. NIES-65]